MGYTPPYLEVRKVGTTTTVYPSGATGDTLLIRANNIDTYPYIAMTGTGIIKIYYSTQMEFYDEGTAAQVLQIYETPGTLFFEGKNANDDIFLKPAGSGVLKFGTHTGSGDVACNGSIAVKDAAGNARKLMTTA
jgi:hypothetical protein